MNDLTVPQAGGAMAVVGRGFEGMKVEQSDLIIPRAKLLQGLSPEVAEAKFDGAKAGLVINSLTMDVLSPRFVPIFCFKSYFRFNSRNTDDEHFNPDYAPGAMLWRSNDPEDPRVKEETQFGPNGENPVAMTCLNFFSLFHDASMPIIASFSKTSYKAGKQLLSLARFCSGDMWSRAYQLDTTLQKNDKGTYFTFNVKSLGKSDVSERLQAETWWKMFSQANVKVDEEEEPGIEA